QVLRLASMARFYLLAATANVWVFIAILLAAFAVQIATSELPCPLCVMQRIALMLTAVGPLYILLRAPDGVLPVVTPQSATAWRSSPRWLASPPPDARSCSTSCLGTSALGARCSDSISTPGV